MKFYHLDLGVREGDLCLNKNDATEKPL